LEKILRIVKYLISLTLVLLVLIQTYYLNSDNTLLPNKGLLFIGWVFTHFVAIILHEPAYRLSLKYVNPMQKRDVIVDRDIWSIIHFMLTPDYFWATYHKNLLAVKTGYNQRSRSDFVKYSNWINLSFAALLYIVLSTYETMFWQQTTATLSTMIFRSFLLVRLISRGLEMIIAFYRDVATRTPSVTSSDLSKYKRISLAVHSYFELVIAYAIIYFILDFPLNFDAKPDFTLSLLDSLYFSLGIVTFTNVNIEGFNNLHKLIVYSQVITAQVLIGLSLASYIGWEDKQENID
jgi:hypothetical protein